MMEQKTEVREKGYTAWTGGLIQRRFPWSPIARTGIRLAFRKKRFKPLFAMSFVPAVVFLAGVYIAERIEDFKKIFQGGGGKLLNVDPAFFFNYYTNPAVILFMVLIMAFAGSGLISDDIRNNSLQLYFSRPMRKTDYILGKLAVPVFFIGLLTIVPGLMFMIFKLIFSGSLNFLAQYPLLILAVSGESIVYVAVFGIYTLALSAASRNSRYVMVMVAAAYFLSDILSAIIRAIIHSPYAALFSLSGNLRQISASLFGHKPPFEISPAWSFLVLAVLCAAGTLFLFRKVRGAEVIK